MRLTSMLLTAVLAGAAPWGVHAQVLTGRNISLQLARTIGDAAIAACKTRTRADRSIIPRNNFNVFNRANFTDWVLNERSPLFGEPDAADGIAYQPRIIQVGFRTRF